jgi:hypothetical protein
MEKKNPLSDTAGAGISHEGRQVSFMRKVLLCGGSLLTAGLEASLKTLAELELDRIPPQPEALRQRLCEHPPDVLIVELAIIEKDSILHLLTRFPQLIVVGLDPDSECVLLLSLQQETPVAAVDLVRMLQERTHSIGETISDRKGDMNQGRPL